MAFTYYAVLVQKSVLDIKKENISGYCLLLSNTPKQDLLHYKSNAFLSANCTSLENLHRKIQKAQFTFNLDPKVDP